MTFISIYILFNAIKFLNYCNIFQLNEYYSSNFSFGICYLNYEFLSKKEFFLRLFDKNTYCVQIYNLILNIGVLFIAFGNIISTAYLTWCLLFQLISKCTRCKESNYAFINPLLIPIIPGINVPFDTIISFWVRTILSCCIHEIGHAVAAMKEKLPIKSFGFFLILIFPGAYVTIDESLEYYPPYSQLKIYAAGVFNNILFFLLCCLFMKYLPTILSYLLYIKVRNGVVVIAISEIIKLHPHVSIGDVVHAVNGCEVHRATDFYRHLSQSCLLPLQGQIQHELQKLLAHNSHEEHLGSLLSGDVLVSRRGVCLPQGDLLGDLWTASTTLNAITTDSTLQLYSNQSLCFLHESISMPSAPRLYCSAAGLLRLPSVDPAHRCSDDASCTTASDPSSLASICIKPLSFSPHAAILEAYSSTQTLLSSEPLGPLLQDGPLQVSDYGHSLLLPTAGTDTSFSVAALGPTLFRLLLSLPDWLYSQLWLSAQANLSLALLNAAPLPSLDGAKAARCFARLLWPRHWRRLQRLLVGYCSLCLAALLLLACAARLTGE